MKEKNQLSKPSPYALIVPADVSFSNNASSHHEFYAFAVTSPRSMLNTEIERQRRQYISHSRRTARHFSFSIILSKHPFDPHQLSQRTITGPPFRTHFQVKRERQLKFSSFRKGKQIRLQVSLRFTVGQAAFTWRTSRSDARFRSDFYGILV